MAIRKSTNNGLQNITHKTKDRVTQTPPETGGELRCSGGIGSSCSNSGTRQNVNEAWNVGGSDLLSVGDGHSIRCITVPGGNTVGHAVYVKHWPDEMSMKHEMSVVDTYFFVEGRHTHLDASLCQMTSLYEI
jgi:hypothetical protein